MEARNVREVLLPLHSEVEALIWAMVYEEFMSVPGHVCNELFSTGEESFRTRRIVSF